MIVRTLRRVDSRTPVMAVPRGARRKLPSATRHALSAHPQVGVDDNLAQPLVPQRDHDRCRRVVGVGLAALPAVERPGPRGQLRRHVQHLEAPYTTQDNYWW